MRFKQYAGEKCAACGQQSQRVYNRRALESKRVSLCDECHKAAIQHAAMKDHTKDGLLNLSLLSEQQLLTLQGVLL